MQKGNVSKTQSVFWVGHAGREKKRGAKLEGGSSKRAKSSFVETELEKRAKNQKERHSWRRRTSVPGNLPNGKTQILVKKKTKTHTKGEKGDTPEGLIFRDPHPTPSIKTGATDGTQGKGYMGGERHPQIRKDNKKKGELNRGTPPSKLCLKTNIEDSKKKKKEGGGKYISSGKVRRSSGKSGAEGELEGKKLRRFWGGFGNYCHKPEGETDSWHRSRAP